MRLIQPALLAASVLLIGCETPEAPNVTKDPPADAGTVVMPDASVGAKPTPNIIAPVTGAGESSSTNFQGHFTVTAPHPAGKTSSPNHQANISVTGEQP